MSRSATEQAEIARLSVRMREEDDLRLLIRAYDFWMFDIGRRNIEVWREKRTWDLFPVEVMDGIPILTDDLRAALRRAIGEQP